MLRKRFAQRDQKKRKAMIIALSFSIVLLLSFIILAVLYTMQNASVQTAVPVSSTLPESSMEESSVPESSDPESSEESSEDESSQEEDKIVYLSVTTAQNDLRIRFYNKSWLLFTNTEFEVTVEKSGGTSATHKDTDKDGKIDLTGIAAGVYKITLQVTEGYRCEVPAVSVTVKDKVKYEVLDHVKDDVKKEEEIVVEEEETPPKPAEPEPTITNTVKLVPSTQTANVSYEAVAISKVKKPYAQLITATEDTNTAGFTLNYSAVSFVLNADTGTIQLKAYLEGKSSSAAWNSADTKIVRVDANGTLTPVAVGSTLITATKNGQSASCTITVSALSSSTALLTTGGQTLYLKKGNSYQKAVASDYTEDGTFYQKKTVYTYTGWQTLSGKTYYYDEKGNYVTGNQIIGGVEYTFGANGVLTSEAGILGIDVSKYQGTINWQAVKASGVEFVIIRCAYRGWGSGVLVEDPYFRSYLSGAKAAGLDVGIYFFSQAINEVEAVEEASACVEYLNGTFLEYPIFIDIEDSGGYPNGRADKLTKAQRTSIAKAFCETVRSAGYQAGVYANTNYFTHHLDASQLSSYHIWLAQYAEKPTYTGRYDIWQYTAKGSVDGISGNVDMNIAY